MYLESKDIVDRPVDQVFALVRDDLPRLVPYMPNVDRIEVLSREQKDGEIRIVNQWFAKAEIPGPLKKVMKPEYFSWKDTATWIDAKKCVNYKIEALAAKGLFSVKGTNTFSPIHDGEKTELKIACEVEISPEKIPGVPGFLARGLKTPLEALIRAIMEPNLTSLAKQINSYFKKTGA
ncbi:MAG: SRPBCC family protein [Bdellovibrionales bacterium]|nr:SRPBCC family protein [Bdellovibrionales bacterium]